MSAGAAFSLAATGFQAAGALVQGSAQAAGDMYQAKAMETASQYGEIKANETSQQMTSSLQRSIGNIQAVRASANTDPSSPTGLAIVARAQALGDTRTQIAVGNIQAQATQDADAAKYYSGAAQSALLGGYLGAAGDILSGIGGMASGGSPGGDNGKGVG